MKILLRPVFVLALAIVSGGCGHHYVTPSAGVSLQQISDGNLRSHFDAKPAAVFPANLAVVRVQDSGYVSYTARGYGTGRYSIVTTRDIETDQALEEIASLPLVRDVAPIGRILVPTNASSIRDLRAPAAQLRSDLLLVYSVDTAFHIEGKSVGPLTTITLGLIPNKKAHVTTTVSGAIVDVRTGFIYGTTEASATESQRTTVWSKKMVIDSARRRAETEAFDNFVDEFRDLWKGVVDMHAATVPTPAAAQSYDDVDTHYRVRFGNDSN